MTMKTSIDDYRRVAEAIGYIDRNFAQQPSLKQIADHAGISEFHFQRLFKRWAGITPKRFVQCLTAQHAGALLRKNLPVLDASIDAGLSSTSRLHELFVNVYAMTPDEYRGYGKSLTIRYGCHETPFGFCLIGLTQRGICWMSFSDTRDQAGVLRSEWKGAELVESIADTAPVIEQVFFQSNSDIEPVSLHLKGTNLQIRVWEALLKIPFGEVYSYTDVARSIERPDAVRAVASAIGRNPVSYIVPCHRVIRQCGALGGYEWGITRKQAMLVWEQGKAGPLQSHDER